MAVSVPYDVILEILHRVKDVVTLLRCATTCKGLCRLLAADLSMVRRCLTEDVCRRSAPFAGFFTERRLRRDPISAAPCLVPPSRPVLDSRCRSLRFFLPNAPDDRRFFNHAVPLASRHGLLLVRLDLYSDRKGDLLAVCNLLTGTVVVLPRLGHNSELDHHDVTGYAILTSKDCSANNNDQLTFFKVLVIGIHGSWSSMQYRLRTFSSAGEARWDVCAGSVEGGNIYMRLWQPSAVVCRGMVHWLFWCSRSFYTYDVYTSDVTVETNHFSFTRRPMKLHYLVYPHYEPYISVDTEERLTLFFIERRGPRIEIWTLHNNKRWSHTRVVTLKQLMNQHKESQDAVSYTCLGEKGGTLLVKDNYHHVFLANAMTGAMHKVKNWPHRLNLSSKRTVILDMDWPAFFLSRLSVAT